MRIRVNKTIYNHFNGFRNIEYELEWILGYVERTNFYGDVLNSIEIKGDMVEYSVNVDVLNLLKSKFSNYKEEDTEKVINVLYIILHTLGGTN